MTYWEKYASLCAAKGKSPNKVAEELGVASGTVTAWKNGRNPSARLLRKVADYFAVSTDYLTAKDEAARESDMAAYLDTLKNDPEQKMLFDLVADATVDEVKATVAFLKVLRGQRDE